ncbi:MAG: riboflavin synthase [Acidobacteriota bacterium]
MFTGLIEAIGRIETLDAVPAGGRLRVSTPLAAEIRPGDSVAVNGTCLTAVDPDAHGFSADLGPATLQATSLGGMRVGQVVNLERPLRADARMGGHFVLGHVDGVGVIRSIRPEGDSHWIDIDLPADLESLVVLKGSIAIDGISLTIAAMAPGTIAVQIIPFTFAHTSLGVAEPGDAVNVEVDVLGKYVARLLSAGALDLQRRSPEPQTRTPEPQNRTPEPQNPGTPEPLPR